MARGGRRAGKAGTRYPNRTDLQGAQLPVNTPKGLPYGDRQKLMAAQQAVPMGTPGAAGAAPGGGGPPVGGNTGGPTAVPGSIPFTGPTERPTEPVTAGLPIGPGPGPEVMPGMQQAPDPLVNAAAELNALGEGADAATSVLRSAINLTLANRGAP